MSHPFDLSHISTLNFDKIDTSCMFAEETLIMRTPAFCPYLCYFMVRSPNTGLVDHLQLMKKLFPLTMDRGMPEFE